MKQLCGKKWRNRIGSRISGDCRNRFRHQIYSRLYVYWTASLLSTCCVGRSTASL